MIVARGSAYACSAKPQSVGALAKLQENCGVEEALWAPAPNAVPSSTETTSVHRGAIQRLAFIHRTAMGSQRSSTAGPAPRNRLRLPSESPTHDRRPWQY